MLEGHAETNKENNIVNHCSCGNSDYYYSYYTKEVQIFSPGKVALLMDFFSDNVTIR